MAVQKEKPFCRVYNKLYTVTELKLIETFFYGKYNGCKLQTACLKQVWILITIKLWKVRYFIDCNNYRKTRTNFTQFFEHSTLYNQVEQSGWKMGLDRKNFKKWVYIYLTLFTSRMLFVFKTTLNGKTLSL